MEKQILFPGVRDGEVFRIGNMKFIKFPDKDGQTPVVMKDIAFQSDFDKNNDLRDSKIMNRLQKGVLPKVIEAVGEENVCTFKTDLTTQDGLHPYEDMESKISLPTMDFYRANVAIFDQHKPDTWWWLATPESAPPHTAPDWILCVSPSGFFSRDYFHIRLGVRPFLILNSSIFESFEN